MHLISLRIRPGGQAALEDLIRKVQEASEKIEDGRQALVSETAIGNLGQYYIAQLIRDPAQLDRQRSPQELLLEAFGQKEAERALEAAAEKLEEVTTALAVHRADLSNGL